MFRGNCPTRLDDKGRLKIPADFKREIEQNKDYDDRFYITSFDGAVIQLYPLKEWEVFEEQVKERSDSYERLQKFLDVTGLYGQQVSMDNQGRLTIAEWLREKFGLKGEVAVIGKLEHIEVRPMGDFVRQVEANPLTREDLNELTRKRTS